MYRFRNTGAERSSGIGVAGGPVGSGRKRTAIYAGFLCGSGHGLLAVLCSVAILQTRMPVSNLAVKQASWLVFVRSKGLTGRIDCETSRKTSAAASAMKLFAAEPVGS